MLKISRLIASTFLSGLALLGAGFSAYAGNAEVLSTLKARYPNTTFTDVKESGLPGLYEVYMGRNIAYTDDGGRLFLFGHLYDMATQRDLTAERMDALNRVDFSSLPLQDAIKTVRGNGQKVVAVFSDPDCPYCKKLEQELAKVDDLTVYIFEMPLEQLHPGAKAKAVSIWCSENREQAWKDALLYGKEPKKASCENPVSRNISLGESLGINGTPTIIASDGRIKAGAVPAPELSAWLDQTAKASEVRK
jgi:thiol:disulfide interchange protein DsbC